MYWSLPLFAWVRFGSFMKTPAFSNCQAILFDFGGTLDSDGEHWLDRFYELYEQAQLDLPRDQIKRAFYNADQLCCSNPKVVPMGLRSLMKHHVRLQFAALNLKDLTKEEEIVDRFCTKTEQTLQRNARFLERLKPAYRLGIISNFYGNVATLCRESGLADSLEVILDSTAIGVSKPDPEIFLIALRKLNLVPAQTVFVGDSYERDITPAQQLGVRTIWLIGPNPRIPENARQPDYEISSLTELESIVLSH
jgi:putative hydrolase of the HAD superfamily